MFLNLATKARTIRRYNRERILTDDDVAYIIQCASISASAGNLQRLRYGFIGNQSSLDAFSKISLGGYLKASEKPTANVAPVGYIVIASSSAELDHNLLIDAGIAAESIVLAAAEREIGACMIRNFDKEYFASLFENDGLSPILVIALGYPSEEARIVPMQPDGNVKYYIDSNYVNCIPKRSVKDILIFKKP